MAIDLEAVKKRLEARPRSSSSSGEGKDVNWFKIPRSGSVKVRFLPPYGDAGFPGKIVYKHYNLPDKASFTCFKTWKMECPICKVIEELKYKVDSSIDEFVSKAIAFHNVLVIDGSDPKTGAKIDPHIPYVMKSGEYNFYWLLSQIANPEIGDVTDPMTGSTVIFKRKVDAGALERSVARASTPIADSPEAIQAILEKMKDLDAIWREPDEKYETEAFALARALQLMIKSRVNGMTAAPQPVSAPDVSARPNPQVQVQTQVQPSESVQVDVQVEAKPEPVQAQTVAQAPQQAPAQKPAKAPECFGTYDTTSKEKPDACEVCMDELECRSYKG